MGSGGRRLALKDQVGGSFLDTYATIRTNVDAVTLTRH